MEIKNAKEIEVLVKALNVFMRLGIKAVAMDDVAKELGISKKTLYLYAADKTDLLRKVFDWDMHCDFVKHNEIVKQSKNAIEELFLINQTLKKRFDDMHPSIVYDLQKYYPEIWQMFHDFKNKHILQEVIKNAKRGIEEGLYNLEIQYEVFAKFFVGRFEILFDQILFPKSQFNLVDVHAAMIEYHIRAMATEKGIKQLEKQKNTIMKK